MEDLLTAKELAMRFRVKLPTIRRWQALGLPCLYAGRLPRYEYAAVREWLEQWAKREQRRTKRSTSGSGEAA